MANAFSPEVGMDIGGTNVRPYDPPSLNFSSLGKAVSGAMGLIGDAQTSGTKMSEKDKESIFITPFAQDLDRISQIEDPVKREVYFRKAYNNALTAMPQYREDVKAIYEDKKGIAMPTGSPLSAQENIINEFLKTPEGMDASAVAFVKAKRPDGSTDEVVYNSVLLDRAYQINREVAQQTALKRKVDNGDLSSELAYEDTLLPAMLQKANEEFSTYMSDDMVQAVIAGQGNQLQVQTLINAMNQKKEMMKASFLQQMAGIGIADATGKFSLTSVFSQWDATISMMETNQKLFTDAASRLTADTNAKLLLKAKTPLQVMALSDERAKSEFLITTLTSHPEEVTALQEMMVAPSFLTNTFAAPASDQGMSEALPTGNLSIEDRANILPEFDKNAVALVSQKDDSWKKEQIRGGLFMLNAFTPSKITEEKDAMSFADTLGYTYLSLIDRPQHSYSKANDIQEVFGTKAFATMKAIAAASPTTGEQVYKQAHKYALDEINKQTDSLAANLATITTPGMNPFEVVLENNKVVLKLNPEAVKSDEALKKAMMNAAGAYAPGDNRVETDPYKVLNSYMGIFNRGAGRYAEIVNHVKSLNTLYIQLGMMPDSVKQSEYFGQVHLATRLSQLPKWNPNEEGATE